MRDSIQAHLTVVFTALTVSRLIKHQTRESVHKFVKSARRYSTAQIKPRAPTSPLPTHLLTTSGRPSKRSTNQPNRALS